MYKESYYFQHDYEPTSDPKIIALIGEHGAVGYGVFWRIVEMLHSDAEHKLPKKKYIFSAIAKQMLTSVEQISTIVNYATDVCELFISDENYIISERVNRNFNKRNDISVKRSEAGKRSASMRSNKSEQVLTSVQQNSTNANKGKKRKEKEKEVFADAFLKPGMVL